MKVAKHCSSAFPTSATGSIVGMDRAGNLEITNTFPFPTSDVTNVDGGYANDASALALAAPRAKANIAYMNEMIRHLKEVNVDANNVGWYTSATMGNFMSLGFIENQYHYQRDNSAAVALVFDVSRSSQGSLSLRAFRLTQNFMLAYKEGKFTTERLVCRGLAQTSKANPSQPAEIQAQFPGYPYRIPRQCSQFTSPYVVLAPATQSANYGRSHHAFFLVGPRAGPRQGTSVPIH